jgi:hypothetical protein
MRFRELKEAARQALLRLSPHQSPKETMIPEEFKLCLIKKKHS